MELTFASYNIHKAVGIDGRRDPERIIAVLREMHADVIALQEADRLEAAGGEVDMAELAGAGLHQPEPPAVQSRRMRHREAARHGLAAGNRRRVSCRTKT